MSPSVAPRSDSAAPWFSLLGRPSHDLSLESLRLEDLVGNLVRDVSEVLDEIDIFIVREIRFAAALGSETGPHDLGLPDRVHALMRLGPDPAEEVRGLIHADPGDFATADWGEGLRHE